MLLSSVSWFQFPSNGKVDSKTTLRARRIACLTKAVSIPFKRESGFKVFEGESDGAAEVFRFQFPSNGKVDSKRRRFTIGKQPRLNVSIPFKRESGFKGNSKASQMCDYIVSIPFKRESGFKDKEKQHVFKKT